MDGGGRGADGCEQRRRPRRRVETDRRGPRSQRRALIRHPRLTPSTAVFVVLRRRWCSVSRAKPSAGLEHRGGRARLPSPHAMQVGASCGPDVEGAPIADDQLGAPVPVQIDGGDRQNRAAGGQDPGRAERRQPHMDARRLAVLDRHAVVDAVPSRSAAQIPGGGLGVRRKQSGDDEASHDTTNRQKCGMEGGIIPFRSIGAGFGPRLAAGVRAGRLG